MWIGAGLVLLAIPALLLNLGLLPLSDDEGIRATVALEMLASGDFLTPRLFDELYLNKPPLFNWLLAGWFVLLGSSSEFAARSFTVLALAVFVWYIYRQNRKHLYTDGDAFQAWLPALAFLTCGRVLFWDSMLALIDITFSLVIYVLFVHVHANGSRQRWGWLFAGAYALAAAGFMLKGLPAVVFLGLTLLTWFAWQKRWSPFFSRAHLLGSLCLVLPLAAYYGFYLQANGGVGIFETLFHESAKRTFAAHGMADALLHFFTFPFEVIYHFLPWTLLVVFLFLKKSWQDLRAHPFVTWNLLAFGVNILPYWSSVEVYPRYLLMHVPLLFTVLCYLYWRLAGHPFHHFLQKLFLGLAVLAALAPLATMYWEPFQQVPFWQLKTAVLIGLLGLLAWACWRLPPWRPYLFVATMLVLRIGFDWFVLPARHRDMCSSPMREQSEAAARLAGDKPVCTLEYSLGFQPATAYYFTRTTGRPLRRCFEPLDSNALYLLNPDTYPPGTYDTLAIVRIRWECRDLLLARLNERFYHWLDFRRRQQQAQ